MSRDALEEMFSAVPGRYDSINRVATLGLDGGWRRAAVEEATREAPREILDLCTGTGDMAVLLAETTRGGAAITACDFAGPMLEAAKRKARRLRVDDRVSFLRADAAALPFQDGRFDAVTIAFGFRNLTFENRNRERHLAEMVRVLRPGGRLVVVESSQPKSGLVRACFRAYLAAFVAPAGGLLSGRAGAYRYLSTSARRFPCAEEIAKLLEAAGLSAVGFRRLMLGAAAVHWGRRDVTAAR